MQIVLFIAATLVANMPSDPLKRPTFVAQFGKTFYAFLSEIKEPPKLQYLSVNVQVDDSIWLYAAELDPAVYGWATMANEEHNLVARDSGEVEAVCMIAKFVSLTARTPDTFINETSWTPGECPGGRLFAWAQLDCNFNLGRQPSQNKGSRTGSFLLLPARGARSSLVRYVPVAAEAELRTQLIRQVTSSSAYAQLLKKEADAWQKAFIENKQTFKDKNPTIKPLAVHTSLGAIYNLGHSHLAVVEVHITSDTFELHDGSNDAYQYARSVAFIGIQEGNTLKKPFAGVLNLLEPKIEGLWRLGDGRIAMIQYSYSSALLVNLDGKVVSKAQLSSWCGCQH